MILNDLRALRRADTPLVGIATADQDALIALASREINGNTPHAMWDCLSGLTARNEAGQEAIQDSIPGDVDGITVGVEAQTRLLSDALVAIRNMPSKTMVWVRNAHRFLDDPLVSQGIASLREIYRGTNRTLILLGSALKLPDELRDDVVLLEEELPDDKALTAIVAEIHKAADVEAPADPSLAVAAVRGLSAFGAEQVLAMSMEPKGLNYDAMWARKRTAIAQVDGLSLSYGGPTLASVGGLTQLSKLGKQILEGPRKPAAVVFIDEIEKAMGGAAGDLSGTSQDQLGVLLSEMEDRAYQGLILVGPPGSGKSMFAKQLGATGEVPTCKLDLGAAKGSLVGESERRIRAAMRTLRGIAGGGTLLFVATSNRLASIPPELRRRFTLGIWFCDLPTPEERETIWALHLRGHGLDPKTPRPTDTDWTGAEIRNACRLASDLSISLTEAAQYMSVFAQSAPDALNDMRTAAHGKYLSASVPGYYRKAISVDNPGAVSAPKTRNLKQERN